MDKEIKKINKQIKELNERKKEINKAIYLNKWKGKYFGEKEFHSKIASNIYKIRTEKGYSMEKFIEEVGLEITRSTFWGIERGRQKLSCYHLYLIMKHFNLSIEDLLV